MNFFILSYGRQNIFNVCYMIPINNLVRKLIFSTLSLDILLQFKGVLVKQNLQHEAYFRSDC